ncbi:hypothetical protein WA158_000582 [Blastocystis sp. Blastoise]
MSTNWTQVKNMNFSQSSNYSDIPHKLDELRLLLNKDPNDYVHIQELTQSVLDNGGEIPNDLRIPLWLSLLEVNNRREPDVENHIETKMAIQDENFEKVLNADVDRTFSRFEPVERDKLRGQLRTLIICYCTKFNVSYWQGMHDILSVLLLLNPQPDLDTLFKLFSSFLQRFLPYVFDDSDCIFLQHLFRYIDFLVQYHDPEVSKVLQQFSTCANLYTPSWLLTLWAHHLEQDVLLHIWDFYITYNNPVLHIFVILAYILQNRDSILSSHDGELPRLMTHLPSPNCTQLFHDALNYLHNTPSSFLLHLSDIILGKVIATHTTLNLLKNSLCIYISPQEILTSCLRDAQTYDLQHYTCNNRDYIRYMIFDLRGEDAYIACHFKGSKILLPELLEDPERLLAEFPRERILAENRHVLLLTSETYNENKINQNSEQLLVNKYTCLFLQRGYKYISYVEGGFEAIYHECQFIDKNQLSHIFAYSEKKQEAQSSILKQLGLVGIMDELFGTSNDSNNKEKTLQVVVDKLFTPDVSPLIPPSGQNSIVSPGSLISANTKNNTQLTNNNNNKSESIKLTQPLLCPDNPNLLNYTLFQSNDQFKKHIFKIKSVKKCKNKDKEEYVYQIPEKILLLTKPSLFILNPQKSDKKDYAYIEEAINYKNINKLLTVGTKLLILDVQLTPSQIAAKEKYIQQQVTLSSSSSSSSLSTNSKTTTNINTSSSPSSVSMEKESSSTNSMSSMNSTENNEELPSSTISPVAPIDIQKKRTVIIYIEDRDVCKEMIQKNIDKCKKNKV